MVTNDLLATTGTRSVASPSSFTSDACLGVTTVYLCRARGGPLKFADLKDRPGYPYR